jgi:hypothetical protein
MKIFISWLKNPYHLSHHQNRYGSAAGIQNKHCTCTCENRKVITTVLCKPVLHPTHRDRIYELVDTRIKESDGQKSWLSLYPQALTDVCAALSPKEVDEAERLAAEWSDRGIPAEKQRV